MNPNPTRAVPIDVSFYVSPNTITDLTLWVNGSQATSFYTEIKGRYLYCEYTGPAGTGILKATGYQDLEVELIEGTPQYYTMIQEAQMASSKSYVHLDMNGNEIQNVLLQKLASAPTTNVASGRVYYNTTDNKLYVYDGTNWVDLTSQGNYTFTNGIQENSRVVSIKLATGSNAGNVTFTADANGLSGTVAAASTSAAGVIEIATDSEASTGTSETLAVNPKQLATKVTANSAITGATKTKITYDSKGLVTSGADLEASDIPNLTSTKINALTDYTKGSTATAIATTDTLNSALSKLENQIDAKVTGNTAITGATKCKITYDSKGLVTSGADLADSDIPNLSLSKITDVTATASEVNVLDGITASTAELNIMDGVTVTASDINSVTSKIGLSDLSIDSGSTNYLEYSSSTGKFGAKVDTTVTDSSTKLVTSGAVSTAIANALVGGVIYKGTWNITSATDYSGITLPVKKGYMYYVTGTGPKTIGGIEWNAGDYLLVNDDVAAGGSLTGKVEKIDNTEAADIVRLNATQTLTNKTIDADDNTISDLTTSNLKSGVLQTTVRAISSATDTAIASEKAIATALADKQNKIAAGTQYDVVAYSGTAGTISTVTRQTSVRAAASAVDTAYPTEKAVRTELDLKANLESPTFTGTPTAPTATTGDNSTQIATTAFVQDAMSSASLTIAEDNPALTQSGGVCTWTITNTLNNADVQCIVREKTSGEEVGVQKIYTASTITIKFNSSSNVSAATYRAVIIGQKIASNINVH